MKQFAQNDNLQQHPTALGLALALSMVLALIILMLSIPMAAPQPAHASTTSVAAQALEGVTAASAMTGTLTRPVRLWPRVRVLTPAASPPSSVILPDWVLALQKDSLQADGEGSPMTIVQSAPEQVSLGEMLHYSVVITNASAQTATALIQNVLPVKTLDSDVECQPECTREVEVMTVTIQIPTQYGAPPYTKTVTTTHQIKWQNLPVAQGETVNLAFSIRVTGQDDGTILENRAYVRYTLADGTVGTAMSNETATAVQVYVAPGSGTSLSDLPTWHSEEQGGTASLDWGDYDGDGYLDLVVGGSSGTAVYHNERGRLARLWGSNLYTHNVHWADFDGDGKLELVSIGYDWWTGSVSNHIYHLSPDGNRFLDAGPVSFANQKLLRMLPADYDGDGDLDLIAVTYRTWTVDGCTIRVYLNDGGHFTGSHRCLADPYEDYGMTTENLLSLGDYDNDDDLDLVADVYHMTNPGGPCPYEDMLWIMTNQGGSLTGTVPITVDTFAECNWPVDVAWGDYDGDGDLDLAAAIPVLSGPPNQQVRIYHNRTAEGSGPRFTTAFVLDLPYDFPPYAVEWVDLNLDGNLDLAVAGSSSAARVYTNQQGSFVADRFLSTPEGLAGTFALDLAAADYDNDGDLDLAVGNPLEPDALFTTFASHLSPELTTIAARPASSVAWGDVEGDGDLDLLFGPSESTVNSELYYNEDGDFSSFISFPKSGFGPHSTAFGDVNGDGALDIALGTAVETQVYLQGNRTEPDWYSPPYLVSNSLAWGDADDDGDLDLAVGTDNHVFLFVNQGTSLAATPVWTSTETADTRSIAWGGYDNDRYLDLAVGNYNDPSRIYHNNGDNTFSLAWSSPDAYATTSAAWGDYDGDGDLDLTLGNWGQANLIFENENGAFGTEPIWASEEPSRTTSLAWGDWDNDGDLDLAVGNSGEPNQVYLNQHSRPGLPRLIWLWKSAAVYPTSGVAWGDRDGDGDLDLAMSSASRTGIYDNNMILPSHLTEFFTPTMLLPDSPSYAAVERPGTTDDAYFYSSADILSGPEHPTVTVSYNLFDPDGTRRYPGSDEAGNVIARTLFEFSPDGGGTWRPATLAIGSPPLITTTLRLGQPATAVWDAGADAAISDNARLRISIIPYIPTGPVQRAMTSAISPPFRVRGTSCLWPRDAAISVSDPHPDPGDSVRFEGSVAQASGILTFTWAFGDGSTAVGQVVFHTYTGNSTNHVRLTVRSEPCPIAKEVFANMTLVVGTGLRAVHLPLISNYR